jgi:hypothetical protein
VFRFVAHRNVTPIFKDLFNEVRKLRSEFELNGYAQDFTASVINYKDSSRPDREQKHLGSVYVPHANEWCFKEFQIYRESGIVVLGFGSHRDSRPLSTEAEEWPYLKPIPSNG